MEAGAKLEAGSIYWVVRPGSNADSVDRPSQMWSDCVAQYPGKHAPQKLLQVLL